MEIGSDKSNALDAAILLEHTAWMRALARRLVFDEHHADDIVQESLLTAWRTPPRNARALVAFLKSVVRNLASRRVRDAERARSRERCAARSEPVPFSEAMIERAEQHRIVVDVLIALAEPYRTTLLLRFFEGMSSKDIADHVGCPNATVRTRLRRAIVLMREHLDERHPRGRAGWLAALLPITQLPRPLAARRASPESALRLAAVIAIPIAILVTWWSLVALGHRDPDLAATDRARPTYLAGIVASDAAPLEAARDSRTSIDHPPVPGSEATPPQSEATAKSKGGSRAILDAMVRWQENGRPVADAEVELLVLDRDVPMRAVSDERGVRVFLRRLPFKASRFACWQAIPTVRANRASR